MRPVRFALARMQFFGCNSNVPLLHLRIYIRQKVALAGISGLEVSA